MIKTKSHEFVMNVICVCDERRSTFKDTLNHDTQCVNYGYTHYK